MKCIYIDSIPNETKFAAIYHDGSGANLFMVTKQGHLVDHDGDEINIAPDQYLRDAGYGYWLPLPPKFKLWFEQ